ncbi:UNVERIFIED_CONTAM: hypothetical protein PYX00_002941 [Menopon gallinae]|uniref:C2H2-type domain-containing protein n=1 Tax=Menopon gallinae TaxID=328185 RepID=A0AAW2HZ29_9NEOP
MSNFEDESKKTDSAYSIFDVYVPLVCEPCNKSFEKKTDFKAHLRSHKYDDHTYESRKRPSLDRLKPYECILCRKRFTAKKNLLKHLRVIHKNASEAEKLKVKKTKCPKAKCMFACRKMRDLRNHVEKHHGIKILKDILQFTDEASFLKWKKEEEDNSVASFVSFRGRGILKNGTVKQVLLCHRTGQYCPKGTGRHRLKAHGSCKIGGACPAAMEVFQSPDGQINVNYYKTHLGHSQDVIHLQLSRDDRAKLSERIKQGFSLDAILEDIEESIDPESGKTKRIHLLSRKDLCNIMQSSNNKKHKSNLKTVIGESLLKNDVKNNSGTDDVSRNCDSSGEKETAERTTSDPPITSNKTDDNTEIEVSNTEGSEVVNKTSQVIIVPPNLTVPEVIVLQQAQTVARPLTKQLVPKTANKKTLPENTKKSAPKSEKSPLATKLQEKIDKLCSLVPKSEHLTPKQYETINRKLDSIISVFDSVSVKSKAKKGKKSSGRKVEVAEEQKNEGPVLECVVATQNVVKQIYETPVYAYVCNYN